LKIYGHGEIDRKKQFKEGSMAKYIRDNGLNFDPTKVD
jgi:hypothetical protein